MNVMDQILERLNLKYEDLTSAERETLMSWIETMDSNQLTIELVKGFVHNLRDSVEQEIVNTQNDTKKDIFLKARLRNLMLLEAFLSTPEKARKALDRAVAGIASNRSAKGSE